MAEMFNVDPGCCIKDCAARGLAKPVGKGIAFAHGAQIVHQVKRAFITYRAENVIRHRQRQSGTLDQRPKLANFAHRGDPGRQAAGCPSLALGQRGAQFVQGLAAEQGRDQQAIGAQGIPGLYKLSDRIIRPVQAQVMDQQIMALRIQRQGFVIINHGRTGQGIGPEVGKRADHCRFRKHSFNICESFLNVSDHHLAQEGCRSTPGALAIACEGRAISQARWNGHAGADRRKMSQLQSVIHALYPPQCVNCRVLTESDFALCGPCWREAHFIGGLACNHCGLPLPGDDRGSDEHCDDCLRIARPWQQGRAVLLYRDLGRKLVLALKHGDRIDLARPAGAWMAQVATPMLREGMLVVPIPLHRWRLLRRRYNQAALLSSRLARIAGLDHLPDALVRTRATAALDGHSRDARFTALAGAIRPHPRRGGRVAGRPVLLVDDVMTSGATLAAATEALLEAGAAEVSVQVLARVGKDA